MTIKNFCSILAFTLTGFVVAFTLLACGNSQPNAPEYTEKTIKVVDTYNYDCGGYNFCAYLCYFGDNSGKARVFAVQNGQALSYQDVWFYISLNSPEKGTSIYSVCGTELTDPFPPFRFLVLSPEDAVFALLPDGQQVPVRVKKVPEGEVDELLSDIRMPRSMACPDFSEAWKEKK